jgi:hypothetical protein
VRDPLMTQRSHDRNTDDVVGRKKKHEKNEGRPR